MINDQYVEYDLETKTATQYIEDFRNSIEGSWFDGRSLDDVVLDFGKAVGILRAKWLNKAVKILAEYIQADGTRKGLQREVTFTDLKFSWTQTPWGNSTMEMNLYLSGVRPMTEEEIQGMKVQEQKRHDQQRGCRKSQLEQLKAEFEADSQ